MHFACFIDLNIGVLVYSLFSIFLYCFFGIFLYRFLLSLQPCQVYVLAGCKPCRKQNALPLLCF